LKQAIKAYKEALRFRTPNTAPLGYAETQMNLGIAYADLAQTQERETNSERAIAACQEALRFYSPTAAPLGYALAHLNLGTVYAKLAQLRDRELNLERAIAAFKEALRFCTPHCNPIDYAVIQLNLGTAYVDLAQVRAREPNLERAIAVFQEALRFCTPTAAPSEYASIQHSLGIAYAELARVRERESNLERAVLVFQEALRFYTLDTDPLAYAMIQNDLGTVYSELAQMRGRMTDLLEAIRAYREALDVLTPDKFPSEYAATQSNLGVICASIAERALLKDAKRSFLKGAITALQKALRFCTPESNPLRYVDTQGSLGNAYLLLAQVRERETNLRRAIAAYQKALEVIDRFFLASSVEAQIGLQERWIGLYARAVAAHLQAGQLSPALAVAEGSKSRILIGFLGRGAIPAPSAIPGDLARRERALAEELASLDAAALARLGLASRREDSTAHLQLIKLRGEDSTVHLQRLERRRALVEQLRALWSDMERYGRGRRLHRLPPGEPPRLGGPGPTGRRPWPRDGPPLPLHHRRRNLSLRPPSRMESPPFHRGCLGRRGLGRH